MMQSLVVLAVFLAVAFAYPSNVVQHQQQQPQRASDQTRRDDAAAMKRITSSGYLDQVLGRNPAMVAMTRQMTVPEDVVVPFLRSRGLEMAADIAEQVDIDKILNEARLEKFTLFAPSDFAVLKWSGQVQEDADIQTLTRLVKAWIVPKDIRSADMSNDKVVESIDGDALRFNNYRQSDKLTVNGAEIVQSEMDQEVVDNGYIQVVDRAIFPLADGNVLEILGKIDSFSKFLELVKEADLEQEFSADALTLFAPVNEALASLPQGVMEDLRSDKPKLQQAIRYYALAGTWYSAGLAYRQRMQTLSEDNEIDVKKCDDNIYLNEDADGRPQALARFVDIPANNGVIHVIDKPLTPPQSRYVLEF